MKYLILILTIIATTSKAWAQKAPGWEWAKQFGAIGFDLGGPVVIDDSAYIYQTGTFTNTFVLGSDTLTGKSSTNPFLVKYNSKGEIVWAKQFGGTARQTPLAMKADKQGNVYICGMLLPGNTYVVLGNDTFDTPGWHCGFLMKFDNNGNILWSKVASSKKTVEFSDMTIDNSGDIIIAGHYSDTLVLDIDTLKTGPDGKDVLLIKYDTSGTPKWVRVSAGNTPADWEEGLGVSSDSWGNIYVTGYFTDSIYMGNKFAACNCYGNAFLAKYDKYGSCLWIRYPTTYSLTGNASLGFSVANDAQGNVYLSANFNDSISFDNHLIKAKGIQNNCLVKYDSAGNALWAKNVGGSGYVGRVIAYEDAVFATSTDDGMGISKYSNQGNLEWTQKPGSYSSAFVFTMSITFDEYGKMYASGGFRDKIAFGKIMFINNSDYDDVFLARLGLFPEIISDQLRTGCDNVRVYPNPVSDQITVTFDDASYDNLFVIDQLGRVVIKIDVCAKTSVQFNTQNLDNGFYIVRLCGIGIDATKKFLIEH